MPMQLQTILLPFLSAFLLTLIATPISIVFIKKLKLIDDPKTHKHPALLHTKPVPRGGGIPLFFGMIIASIFFIPITNTTLMIFAASAIALLVGTLDDRFDLSPYVRYAANILCAILIIGSGVSFPHFITNPLGGILHLDVFKVSFSVLGTAIHVTLADLLALLWIVWVMNMLNWSKGVDGQMPGIVAISAFVIGLLSLRFSLTDQSTVIAAHLSFIIAGASVAFLLFNYYPAKIFPGYGATSMYLLLAAVSLISSAKLATAVLVMGIPMIDGIFTLLRRIFSGKSPFWGDKKHLHHLLLKLGYSQRQVALFYWVISAILGTIALTLSSKGKLFAMIMLGVIIGGAILFLHVIIKKQDE
ncbi:MAG: undecaprenyl/decaprenyl-phosphate alpha-N-acetylglucosaminyl 1-phosphate transferase [Patescibacteria group bacterium]|nr:undecaprenyl/decaprenyl-phosphate alpha-N-acetylglucosaminyl 1-phosphate transferase [Patescibacteria group bacterium]MDE2588995.1 undecaprenyl/decaprenyl-phosphate alpha-N-acetylglucosaminyl 1-phosphate transferase [Patescibacteria group bacterium]